MKNEFDDPGFLFHLNSNRGSICSRFEVIREVYRGNERHKRFVYKV